MEVANCNQAAYFLAPYAASDEKLCEDILYNNRGPCKGLPPNGGFPNGGYANGGYPNGGRVGWPNPPFGIFGNLF